MLLHSKGIRFALQTSRSEVHTSELQSRPHLVCRLLLEKKKPELQELATGNDQLLSNPNNWPRFQPGDGLSSEDHNPFFVRAADGRFYDLSAELGLDQDQISRGIAVADVNGDGLLD